jgi:hypothetical protein
MLIIDFARSDGSSERVGVVGSCRVHDPLKAAARDGRGAFQWSAFNTFTHTPPEAAQHIAFCRGKLDIPDPFAPFIMRLDHTPLIEERLPRLVETCTSFMVEMSTLDILRCGYYYFNQDYFSQQFVRGAGLGLLEWYRGLSAAPASPDRVAAAMEAMREQGIPIKVSTEEILRSTVTSPLTAQSFEAALAQVAFDVSKRWIFVPHFNVSEKPDEQIAKRATLRDILKQSAHALGFEFYDPTHFVTQAGRAAALEGGGADTFHYAPEFLPVVGEGLYEAIMSGPLSGAAQEARDG